MVVCLARFAQSPVDNLASGFCRRLSAVAILRTWPGAVDLLSPACLLGLSCIALGAVLLAACIFEFVRSGRGTLSPVDPPRHLVVRGLYRYVRNPMYVSVAIIILGEALLTRSVALAIYLAVWFTGANLFVLGYEEPALRRRFGPSYDEYSRKVGRWIPKFHRSQLR